MRKEQKFSARNYDLVIGGLCDVSDITDDIEQTIEKRTKARKRKRGPYRKSAPLPF